MIQIGWMKKNRVLILVLACFFSCRQLDIFEKNTNIPGMQWKSNVAVSGTFMIQDTTVSYNLLIVIRHTDAYRYNNLWLKVGIQAPGDTLRLQRKEFELGNDARGWEGLGMSDIWELRKPLNNIPGRFKKPGLYHFSIYQDMREDPLPNILSAGLRIEKVK